MYIGWRHDKRGHQDDKHLFFDAPEHRFSEITSIWVHLHILFTSLIIIHSLAQCYCRGDGSVSSSKFVLHINSVTRVFDIVQVEATIYFEILKISSNIGWSGIWQVIIFGPGILPLALHSYQSIELIRSGICVASLQFQFS